MHYPLGQYTAAMKLGEDLLRQFGTLLGPHMLIRWHCCQPLLSSALDDRRYYRTGSRRNLLDHRSGFLIPAPR